MLKKLNRLIFSFLTKYLIIYNFLLCAFKIIMVKVITYIQCQKWVIIKSLKKKASAEFSMCII